MLTLAPDPAGHDVTADELQEDSPPAAHFVNGRRRCRVPYSQARFRTDRTASARTRAASTFPTANSPKWHNAPRAASLVTRRDPGVRLVHVAALAPPAGHGRARRPIRAPQGGTVPIRAVVFDIGGVLEFTPDLGTASRWETRLGLAAGEIDARMRDIWLAGGVGAITLDDVHQALRERLGLDDRLLGSYMADLWREYLGTGNAELIAFARGLRPRYLTGIVSNSFVGAREREQEAYGFDDLVDEVVYSHEAGARPADLRPGLRPPRRPAAGDGLRRRRRSLRNRGAERHPRLPLPQQRPNHRRDRAPARAAVTHFPSAGATFHPLASHISRKTDVIMTLADAKSAGGGVRLGRAGRAGARGVYPGRPRAIRGRRPPGPGAN